MAPPANGSFLKPNEEEWRDIFNRLSERFPSVPGKRIAQVLRDHNGHAGEAARTLRDQTSNNVKEHDPDDVEHVATLLSSPVMFKHACKEKFKKFDTNGDGVLEFQEVRDLTNALYEEFGLEIPSEGALLAFFTATDENQDGVLSEREFRKFFEMFLRYAFFDHLKLRQVVEEGQKTLERRNSMKLQRRTTEVWDLGADDSNDSRASSKEALFADAPMMPAEAQAGMARAQSTPVLSPIHEPRSSGKRDKQRHNRQDKEQDGVRRQDKDQERNRTNGDNFCRKLRCVAPAGVAYRSSSTFPDRKDVIAGKGDVVQVLEHWVRTPDGWLPVYDPNGHALFEGTGAGSEDVSQGSAFQSPANASKKRVSISEKKSDMIVRSASQSPSQSPQRSAATSQRSSQGNQLKPNEEEWRPVMERLTERFPHLGEEKIVQALRDNDGHAGKAASMLRYM